MSKKIGLAAFLFVAALAGYNFVTTGNLTLIPSAHESPEMQHMNALDARVSELGNQITKAGQMAGMSGMDTTGDVEHAMNDLEKTEKEIEAVKEKTSSSEIRARCERLIARSRSLRGAR